MTDNLMTEFFDELDKRSKTYIQEEKNKEQNTKLIIEKIAFLEEMNDNLLNQLIKIQKYYENN